MLLRLKIYRIILFLQLILSFDLFGQAEEISRVEITKGSQCDFLAISPNSLRLIYALDSFSPEKPNLFLFNDETKSSIQLSNDWYDPNTISFQFETDNSYFFNSGQTIFYISVYPDYQVKLLYKAIDFGKISNMSINLDRRLIAFEEVSNGFSSIKVLDLKSNSTHVIDTKNKRVNSIRWSKSATGLFIDLEKDVFEYNVSNNELRKIISNVLGSLYVIEDYLIFQKSDELIFLNLVDGSETVVLSYLKLEVHAVRQVTGNSYDISFNNSVIRINNRIDLASIKYNSLIGRILDISNKYYIEETKDGKSNRLNLISLSTTLNSSVNAE